MAAPVGRQIPGEPLFWERRITFGILSLELAAFA
jgi:hypothetical protein